MITLSNKHNNQYIVAKFDANPRRMEPRNIGVLLWTGGGLLAKFLPAEEATFCKNPSVYTRWINHWLKVSRQDKAPLKTGEWVTRDDERFVLNLIDQSSANFMLLPAGEVLTTVTADNQEDILNFLYDEIVQPSKDLLPQKSEVKRQRAQEVMRRCKNALDSIGIPKDRFRSKARMQLRTEGGKWHSFKVDFRINLSQTPDALPTPDPSALEGLLQKVELDSQNSVFGTAFMFDLVAQSQLAQRFENHTAAIYLADEQELQSEQIQSNLELLVPHCHTINLANQKTAEDQLAEVLCV